MRALIFQSSSFGMPWPREQGDIRQVDPWGEDCAAYISLSLRERKVSTQDPFMGTEGWVVDLEFKGRRFSIFVHWAPLGDAREDYWVYQLEERRAFLASLLGRTEEGVPEELCRAIEAAVRADENSRHVRWVTAEEFSRLY